MNSIETLTLHRCTECGYITIRGSVHGCVYCLTKIEPVPFEVTTVSEVPPFERSNWRWRRKRNQKYGFWENIDSGQRVGPIPLDEHGRAAFVPAVRQ
jgi:hypothetical protein